jgi:cob(I)alamin adenosyltransferase
MKRIKTFGRGDQGMTQLLYAKKIAKKDRFLDLIGDMDELAAFLALVVTKNPRKASEDLLREYLEDLHDIAGLLAEDKDLPDQSKVLQMDEEILDLDESMPPIHRFLRFADEKKSAYFNVARTICRRAERKLFKLETPPLNIGAYLNRLSRILFSLARKEEIVNSKTES